MQTVHTILHPTDFCRRCEEAFRLACARARDQDARLIVLHVARPPVYGMLRFMVQEYEKLWDQLHRLQAPDDEVRLEHLLRCGNPAQEILRTAKTLRSDLIVMGTHGRRWLGRLVMGSVAEEVVRAAPCAVLTVPTLLPTWKQAVDLCEASPASPSVISH
jgi:nucleotide-binding universal stress UspA family protein